MHKKIIEYFEEEIMRKAIKLLLMVCLSVCLMGVIAACAKEVENYTVVGAKDWDIKSSETAYDFTDGVSVILEDGAEQAVKVDDSEVDYGVAGTYRIVYYYGDSTEAGVEKAVKIYAMPTFNVGTERSISYKDAKTAGAAAGVTAQDSFGTSLTVSVTDDGGMQENLDYKTYSVTYTAEDKAGNTATLECAVTINEEGKPTVENIDHTMSGTLRAEDCTFSAELNGGSVESLYVLTDDVWAELDTADYESSEQIVLKGDWLKGQPLSQPIQMKLVTDRGEAKFTLTLTETTEFDVLTDGYDNWMFKMGETVALPVPEVESYREMWPVYSVWKESQELSVADGQITVPEEDRDYDLDIRVTMTDGIRTLEEIRLTGKAVKESDIVDPMSSKQFESRYSTNEKMDWFGYVSDEINGRQGVYKAIPSENEASFTIPGFAVDRSKYDVVAFDIYSGQGLLALQNAFGGYILCDVHDKFILPDGWLTVSFDLRNYDKHNQDNPDVGLSIETWGMEIVIKNWDSDHPFYVSNLRLIAKGTDEVSNFEGTDDLFNVRLPAIENQFTINTDAAYVSSGKQSLQLTSSTAAGVSSNQAVCFAVQARVLDSWKNHTSILVDVYIAADDAGFMKFHEKDTGVWWKNVETGADECYAGRWQTMRLDLTAVTKDAEHIWMWCAGRESDTNIADVTNVYIDNIRFEYSKDDSLKEGELLNFSSERYLEKINRTNLIYAEYLSSYEDANGVQKDGVIKLDQAAASNWDSFRINLFENVAYEQIQSITITLCVYSEGGSGSQFNIAFNGSGSWDGCMIEQRGVWADYTWDAEKIQSLGGENATLSSIDIMFGSDTPIYIDSVTIAYVG